MIYINLKFPYFYLSKMVHANKSDTIVLVTELDWKENHLFYDVKLQKKKKRRQTQISLNYLSTLYLKP